MPSKPRTPISYKETTGRVFRPAAEVQAERDALEQAVALPTPPNGGLPDAAHENEETNERINERTNDQEERRVIRHSFDIYHDQLMHLGEIQMRRYRVSGKKPKLGQIVQDALDQYIAAQGADARSHETTS